MLKQSACVRREESEESGGFEDVHVGGGGKREKIGSLKRPVLGGRKWGQ